MATSKEIKNCQLEEVSNGLLTVSRGLSIGLAELSSSNVGAYVNGQKYSQTYHFVGGYIMVCSSAKQKN